MNLELEVSIDVLSEALRAALLFGANYADEHGSSGRAFLDAAKTRALESAIAALEPVTNELAPDAAMAIVARVNTAAVLAARDYGEPGHA